MVLLLYSCTAAVSSNSRLFLFLLYGYTVYCCAIVHAWWMGGLLVGGWCYYCCTAVLLMHCPAATLARRRPLARSIAPSFVPSITRRYRRPGVVGPPSSIARRRPVARSPAVARPLARSLARHRSFVCPPSFARHRSCKKVKSCFFRPARRFCDGLDRPISAPLASYDGESSGDPPVASLALALAPWPARRALKIEKIESVSRVAPPAPRGRAGNVKPALREKTSSKKNVQSIP